MTNAAPEGAALPETIGDWTGHPTHTPAVPRPASKNTHLNYPPFSIPDRIERARQFRCMSAIAYMILGPHHALWRLLRAAETDAEAFAAAYDMVETLPALTRRRLLATHAAVTWPRAPRRAP